VYRIDIILDRDGNPRKGTEFRGSVRAGLNHARRRVNAYKRMPPVRPRIKAVDPFQRRGCDLPCRRFIGTDGSANPGKGREAGKTAGHITAMVTGFFPME
jgi:hypothetical protein